MFTLEARYRPQIFEDVVGQKYPVAFLSSLIQRGSLCRNILLHGSIGSGKTTLARIYAKALNCASPQPTGSPCLACASCVEMEAGDQSHFVELGAPHYKNFQQFKEDVDVRIGLSGRRVIFIDEAHFLSNFGDSFDYFLKKLEARDPDISFCFATTAAYRISPALRSRLYELEIQPLSLTGSIEFLRGISVKERIEVEPEAFALLAGLGEGQPRNMLKALDQVQETGAVTRERVREMFGVDYTDFLIRYFQALAEGDFNLQTSIFESWNESVAAKLRNVQHFLVALYYNDLCGTRLYVDPVVASISSVERHPIIRTFRERFGHNELLAFWEGMIARWPIITNDMTEESLLILVALFQRSVSDPLSIKNARDLPPSSTFTDFAEVSGLKSRNVESLAHALSPSRQKRIKRIKPDPHYLSFDQVRHLFNAASYFTQEYGLRFNAQITIRHRLFGCDGQSEASDQYSEFNRHLDGRLKRWIGAAHRLSVQEYSEDEGHCGRIILCVPEDDGEPKHLQKWLTNWHRAERLADEALFSAQQLSKDRKMNFHWECVRWLCAGLNPKEPVIQNLKIKSSKRRVAGSIGNRHRFTSSQSLSFSPDSLARTTALGMDFLSAFDDRAWDHLYSGWELEEYNDRLAHKQEREVQVSKIRTQYRTDESAEGERRLAVALNQLHERWPDRYARPRKWPIWEER